MRDYERLSSHLYFVLYWNGELLMILDNVKRELDGSNQF